MKGLIISTSLPGVVVVALTVHHGAVVLLLLLLLLLVVLVPSQGAGVLLPQCRGVAASAAAVVSAG